MPNREKSKVLCKTCGIKVVPLAFLREWRYVCNQCYHAQGKARRKARLDAGERPHCRKHPERIVRRSTWIARGHFVCSACRDRNAANDFRPAVKRKHAKRNRWRRTEAGRIYNRKIKRLYRAQLRNSRAAGTGAVSRRRCDDGKDIKLRHALKRRPKRQIRGIT